MKSCVFAGTFDPITKGHFNLINGLLKIYDEVFVVVGSNELKTPFFTEEERLEAVKSSFKKTGIKVFAYSKLKEDYANFLITNGITDYVRGIRNDKDLEFEKKMEKINFKLYPFVKTVYVNAEKEFADLSSTLVREKIQNGQPFLDFVPEGCADILQKAVSKRKSNSK